MDNKKRLKKLIIIILIFIATLNILSVLIWKNIYLDPKLKEIEITENIIRNDILNKKYVSYEEFINKLNEISDIKYIIEDYNKIIEETGDINKNNIPIISELIKINDENYLVKIYNTKLLDISSLILNLFIIHGIVVVIITILLGLLIEWLIMNPIQKILVDIKNYKFDKKPKKNKIKNEIDLIQNEFVKLTDILDEEKKEQTRIIASISHDIKTPLTSIIGYSNLIMNNNLTNEEILKYNEKINLKSNNIKELLNNFDDYLINNSIKNINKERILIKDLIRIIKQDYELELKSNNIKLIIECNIQTEYINIDISKIKRVLSNIIENSVRFINDKGIIKINILKEDKYYKFIISDNGIGVDNKIIKKIFNPLFTTDNSRKISGLGLSICKEFITMHGGKIIAYNNNGLTIEFTIPK